MSSPVRVEDSDPAQQLQGKLPEDGESFQPHMIASFPIGMHVPKRKTLRATLEGLPSFDRPYQIFFTNRSTHFSVAEEDLAASAEFAAASSARLYVHTPYLLNLCASPDDPGHSYITECIRKHLRTGAAGGLKGVVVHVGKAVKLPLPEAMENMRRNLVDSLRDASPECPLLLETPAGQGTETLTSLSEFMTFAASFDAPDRFGVCIDTCHVFATGHDPHDFLQSALDSPDWRPLVKLVHFNDSKTPLNSRVDRHAPLGTGHIPRDRILATARLAASHSIPMIIE